MTVASRRHDAVVLISGTPEAKESATCTLFSLSMDRDALLVLKQVGVIHGAAPH